MSTVEYTFTNGVKISLPVNIAEWMQSDEGMMWMDVYYQMAFDEGYDNGFYTGRVHGGTDDGSEDGELGAGTD